MNDTVVVLSAGERDRGRHPDPARRPRGDHRRTIGRDEPGRRGDDAARRGRRVLDRGAHRQPHAVAPRRRGWPARCWPASTGCWRCRCASNQTVSGLSLVIVGDRTVGVPRQCRRQSTGRGAERRRRRIRSCRARSATSRWWARSCSARTRWCTPRGSSWRSSATSCTARRRDCRCAPSARIPAAADAAGLNVTRTRYAGDRARRVRCRIGRDVPRPRRAGHVAERTDGRGRVDRRRAGDPRRLAALAGVGRRVRVRRAPRPRVHAPDRPGVGAGGLPQHDPVHRHLPRGHRRLGEPVARPPGRRPGRARPAVLPRIAVDRPIWPLCVSNAIWSPDSRYREPG